MSTITSLVNPSAGKVFSGIAGASAGGQEFGAELLSGFRQGFGAAFNAGATLSQTMLVGFLSPLGQSGQAVTRAAGAITNAVGGVFDTLLSGATSLVSFGGKMTSMLGGALLAGIGGAVGLIAGPAGAMLGATIGAALGGILGKALGTIGQFFGNIVSTAGEALGKVAGLLGELGSSLASLLGDVLKTAEDTGRSILKLQGAGYSAKDAGNLVQTVKFFGIDPGKLADKWSKPGSVMSMGARAANMNVPRPDLDFGGFITKFTADFEAAKKAGAQSLAMFKSKAMETGFGDFLATAELGSKRVATMLKVSQAFQVDGAKVGELGGDVAMANNILGGLATQLKLVFAETLLPLLPMISQGFSYIVQNKDAIAGAIQTAGAWLVNDLPPMVLRGAGGMLEAIGGLLNGFSTFTGHLAENTPALLGFIDSIINGLISFGATIAGTVAFIRQGIANMAAAIQNSGIPALLKRINDATGGNGGKIAIGAGLGVGLVALLNKVLGGGKKGDCCCDDSGKGGSKASKVVKAAKSVGRRLAPAARAAARGVGTAARWAGRNLGAAARWAGRGVANLAGNTWRTVAAIPSGAGVAPTLSGIGAAFSATTAAIGAVGGVVGFEALRKSKLKYFENMPSTAQIIGTYTGLTDSPTEQARKGYIAEQKAKAAAKNKGKSPGSPKTADDDKPGEATKRLVSPPVPAPAAPSPNATKYVPPPPLTPVVPVPPLAPTTTPNKGVSPFDAMNPQAGRSPVDAFKQTSAAVHQMAPRSNLAGDPKVVSWTQKHLQDASDRTAAAGQFAIDLGKSLGTKADNWLPIIKELQKLNATTEKNGKKDGGGIDMGAVSAAGLAQIGAYIAQDAARLSARG